MAEVGDYSLGECSSIYFMILLGLLSHLLFFIIGSKVDETTGVLIEPFFLIPVGYLLVFVGSVAILCRMCLRYLKKNIDNNERPSKE